MKGRFGAVTIRPVHPLPDAPANRVLIGAVNAAALIAIFTL